VEEAGAETLEEGLGGGWLAGGECESCSRFGFWC